MLNLYYTGIVTSGMNKASAFMQKDVYAKQYSNTLGFVPYYGTLNIKLENQIEIYTNKKIKNKLKIIKGNKTNGDVYFIKSTIYNKDKSRKNQGAILFPEKSIYKTDTIEFISEKNLRKNMNLKDNDEVTIKI